MAIVVGVVTFVVATVLPAVWAHRSFAGTVSNMKVLFPAPKDERPRP